MLLLINAAKKERCNVHFKKGSLNKIIILNEFCMTENWFCLKQSTTRRWFYRLIIRMLLRLENTSTCKLHEQNTEHMFKEY